MSNESGAESVVVTKALIGTFDILGARAMYAANDNAKSMVLTVVNSISKAMATPQKEMLQLAQKQLKDDSIVKELVEYTSSYLYADTLVFICDLSKLDKTKIPFAYLYFQAMANEITRYMFVYGLPVRGCLSMGITTQYKDSNIIVISGKAYVDSIRIADSLEFSGTVLTEEFYKEIAESNKAMNGLLSLNLVQLPCAVKNDENKGTCVTKNMWCLDWLDESGFLGSQSDIRQLVFNSFTKHGKVVRDSVVGKIDNTETIIRLMISHRNARS